MSKVDLFVPVKGGNNAKSRLAAVLTPVDRQALAAAMARHVTGTAVVARQAGLVASVTIITSCDKTAALARSLGAESMIDRCDGGTAAACLQALGRTTGANATLFVNADLPLLTLAALARLTATTDRVTIAPDRRRIGTNALLVPAGAAIAPRFGTDSFARHRAAAVAAELSTTIVEDAATEFDIDEPGDLAALGQWGGRTWFEKLDQVC